MSISRPGHARKLRFGADVLLGDAILVAGFWLANIVYEAVNRASGEQTTGLAGIARVAILGLVIAMGLRARRTRRLIATCKMLLRPPARAILHAGGCHRDPPRARPPRHMPDCRLSIYGDPTWPNLPLAKA